MAKQVWLGLMILGLYLKKGLSSRCLSDRADLSEPQQVAELQDHLLDAILWLIRKVRTDSGGLLFFARIVSALTELRNLDAQPEKENAESLFRMLLCGNVEVPPIMYELTDVTPMSGPTVTSPAADGDGQITRDARVIIRESLSDSSWSVAGVSVSFLNGC